MVQLSNVWLGGTIPFDFSTFPGQVSTNIGDLPKDSGVLGKARDLFGVLGKDQLRSQLTFVDRGQVCFLMRFERKERFQNRPGLLNEVLSSRRRNGA